MKKRIQLTTGLCAAALALNLATTTLTEEQTTPVTAPVSKRQDTVTPVSATSESPATTATNEETAPFPSEETAIPTVEKSTPAPAEIPVDPRISEIRVIHRRRTLKPDFLQLHLLQMSSTRQLKPVLSPNMTFLEMDQQPLQTKMEKHGIELDTLSLILKMDSITRVLLKKELLPRPLLKSFISMTISI